MSGPADPGKVLWEQPAGRDLARFSIREFNGRIFADLRRWFETGGEWKPGKKGCTLPVEHVAVLAPALTAYCRSAGAGGPDSGSGDA